MYFEKKMYENMMIDVPKLLKGSASIVSQPKLKQWSEFTKFELPLGMANCRDNIVAYVALCYDIGSPFVAEFKSITRRKILAAEDAKLPKNGGKFTTNVEKILSNEVESVNHMIIRYLRLLKNIEWATYITYLDSLFTQLNALRTNTEGSDTKHIIANTKSLREAISELEASFLADDTNRNLRTTMYDVIENEELGLRPEDIAKKIRENGNKVSVINPVTIVTPYD